MKTAICPGSFDPVTIGHIDIIHRAAKLFDKVIVVVMVNYHKPDSYFTAEERVELLKRSLTDVENIEIDMHGGLLAEYAKEKGIVTMIENHGFFCQDSAKVEKIVCGVGDPNFGVLLDIGNFSCVDENSANAAGRLAPYIKHIHAKDFHIKSGNGLNPGKGFFRSRGGNYLRGSIIGHGDIPVMQCLAIAKNAGYDGYVSVEFEGLEKCLDGIEIGFENLKKFTEMI